MCRAYRLILSQGSSIIYRVLVSWKVHTYTSLFRAYRRKVIERVPFESNGFLAGTELLVNGMLMGYRVAEYPAVLYSRVHGTSKAKAGADDHGASEIPGAGVAAPVEACAARRAAPGSGRASMSAIGAVLGRRKFEMNVAIVYILISVLGGAAGQVLLKKGMGSMGPLTLSVDQLGSILWRMATNPYVVFGWAFTCAAPLFWLTALSRVI